MKLIPKTIYFPPKMLKKLEELAAADDRRFSNFIVKQLSDMKNWKAK